MKRIVLTILFFGYGLFLCAQHITLTFVAKDARTNDFIPLDTIKIDNTTNGGDTVLSGPIPKLVLPLLADNNEDILSGHSSLQARPNPFRGTAMITVYVQAKGTLRSILSDYTGRSIDRYTGDFEPGYHQFEIAAHGSRFLVFQVIIGKDTRSIKLMNTSAEGAVSHIKYLGPAGVDLKSTLISGNRGFIFNAGDQLRYSAFAWGYDSASILDSPNYNSVYTFLMEPDVFPPSVTTSAAHFTSSTAVTCGGTVTSDGGGDVIERGVCWSTSRHPTVDLSTITSDGKGTGSFTSNITGLEAGTTYYIRAYAKNSAGNGYGEEISITTPTVPSVATSAASVTSSTTAICGGVVISDGGCEVTSRGICWDTMNNPTVTLSTRTQDGAGTGSFISSITGLNPGTTYYVRAYAINLAGIAYGNDYVFTVPEDYPADWEGKVMTVRGLIPADSMGITLPHEHILIVHKFNYLDLTDVATAISEVNHFAAAGGKTIFDASNIGIGRNPEGLKQISTATGINIIMGSAFYKDKWIHDTLKNKTVEQLTDIIISDIKKGINGIHAGVIGEVGISRPITPFEEKALIAVARAQKATGASVDLHFDILGDMSERHHALDVLEIEGVDLSRVYVSHNTPYLNLVDSYISLIQRGCYVAFDLIGLEAYGPVALHFKYKLELVETIKALIDRGYINNILISQDVAFSPLLVKNGGNGYAHILKNIVPQFKAGGITDEQIHTIMVENPKRILPFRINTGL